MTRSKAKEKEYRDRPENKAKRKEVRDRPENKAKLQEYRDRHENKAKKKEYNKKYHPRPENKTKRKERRDRPENKAKAHKFNRDKYIRLTKEKLKYGKICTCCGLTDIHNLTKDHIIPLSKDGTDTPDNIQLHCFACNVSKGNRLKCTLPHDQEFYDLI